MDDIRTMTSQDRYQSQKPPKRRRTTLYDAVSGRVGKDGFIPPTTQASKYRDTASTSLKPLPPDEVLFQRKGAPVRYEEDDVYAADRHLDSESNAGRRLPDSDLLKVIHAYVADFHEALSKAEDGDGRRRDLRSFDETALFAMGILLEEEVREVVGKIGYRVLLGKGAVT